MTRNRDAERLINRIEEAESAYERGWALLPLSGKAPIIRGWRSAPRPTKHQVRDWIDAGHDLGHRTGDVSGVFVIDVDCAARLRDREAA